ncbi:Coenzyme F420 hydrogenase/dehydrogenase, beta subunit C-terminal domain [Tolumonas osonensis]
MSCSRMIESVVNNGLCIGCGLCVTQCSSNAIKMKVNKNGFYVASVDNRCTCGGKCISVCPFNPEPSASLRTEHEISAIFLNEAPNFNKKIGRYISTYAGYSIKNRLSSSSGGIATYILSELLARGEIQHVISVKGSDTHYEYAISNNIEELQTTAKTKYYPVTLNSVFDKLQELDGNVAIVGVACFIKAIRLAQANDLKLKQKIKFLVGIICGGIKSSFFAEYLASKVGVDVDEYSEPEFRIKDINSTASDYSFGCLDKFKNQKTIKMRTVGDMWGTGLFKANACDYCDDVTAELADVSLGDAWLEPFSNDGRGTNVIVTRSLLAEKIIQDGIEKDDLNIEKLSEDRFIVSQQGSFNHRHDGLGFRIERSKKKGIPIPPKRFTDIKISPLIKIIQIMRMRTRYKSLEVWGETRNAVSFDNKMERDLYWLKAVTKINHYHRAVIKRIRKAFIK